MKTKNKLQRLSLNKKGEVLLIKANILFVVLMVLCCSLFFMFSSIRSTTNAQSEIPVFTIDEFEYGKEYKAAVIFLGPEGLGEYFTDSLIHSLSGTSKYLTIVPRENLNIILKDLNLSFSGFTKELDDAARVGQMLLADTVILGKITKDKDILTILPVFIDPIKIVITKSVKQTVINVNANEKEKENVIKIITKNIVDALGTNGKGLPKGVYAIAPEDTVNLTIDLDKKAPGVKSTRSMKVVSSVPCTEGRYSQINNYFSEVEDWSNSDYIEVWVRGDGINQEPWGGEFSIVLIDGGQEVEERWQFTTWYERRLPKENKGWRKIIISLVGLSRGNPWDAGLKGINYNPNGFINPEWEEKGNGVLDKDKIKGIFIKVLTADEWACGTKPEAKGKKYPDLTLWIDHLVRY